MAASYVRIEKVNSVYIKVVAEPHVIMQLVPLFTFEIPGAAFIKRNKKFAKGWDGKIRLLNVRTGRIYAGLYHKVVQAIESFGCKITDDSYVPPINNISPSDANKFITDLNLTLKLRDYQLYAFLVAIKEQRALIISPTASGKSLIIYLIAEWMRFLGKRTLIVCPTTNLVDQMTSDFIEYNPRSERYVSKVMAGLDHDTPTDVVISTWQSIYDKPSEWFNRFDAIVGDEAHQYGAKALTTLMESATEVDFRCGFTGTTSGDGCNELTLEGLFGRFVRTATTRELIEAKHIVEPHITCIGFEYNKDDCAKLSQAKKQALKVDKSIYAAEVDFIVGHEGRMNKLVSFVSRLKGNTIVLFRYVDKHGKPIYERLSAMCPNVHMVSGATEAATREEIRSIVRQSTDHIIVASFGTYSTGVNIPNIDNIVIASPSRSKIRILQSIGRGLRLAEGKDRCKVFDLYDIIPDGSKPNITLKHFEKRLSIYNKEMFKYTMLKARV